MKTLITATGLAALFQAAAWIACALGLFRTSQALFAASILVVGAVALALLLSRPHKSNRRIE